MALPLRRTYFLIAGIAGVNPYYGESHINLLLTSSDRQDICRYARIGHVRPLRDPGRPPIRARRAPDARELDDGLLGVWNRLAREASDGVLCVHLLCAGFPSLTRWRRRHGAVRGLDPAPRPRYGPHEEPHAQRLDHGRCLPVQVRLRAGEPSACCRPVRRRHFGWCAPAARTRIEVLIKAQSLLRRHAPLGELWKLHGIDHQRHGKILFHSAGRQRDARSPRSW